MYERAGHWRVDRYNTVPGTSQTFVELTSLQLVWCSKLYPGSEQLRAIDLDYLVSPLIWQPDCVQEWLATAQLLLLLLLLQQKNYRTE